MMLSPMQAWALRLLAASNPGTVRAGRDVHAAAADALIYHKLVSVTATIDRGGRIIDLTAAGRHVAAELAKEG